MKNLDARPQRHIASLDGLRGVAILMVISIHFLYTNAIPAAPPAWLSVFHVLQFGWMGVDLFFVLSGFLITGILLDTRASGNYFRSFYSRRSLRIFPLYYLVVGVYLLSLPLQARIPALAANLPDRRIGLSYLVYLNNWYVPILHRSGGTIGYFWSLAVEEQFYLIWPFLVFRLPQRAFVRLCVALCLFLPLLRLLFDPHPSWPASDFVFMNTTTRMDSLVWGALAAMLVRFPVRFARLRPLLPWTAAACALAMLVICFPLHELYSRKFYTQSIGYSILAVGFAAILLMAYHSDSVDGRLAKLLRWPLLTQFGRYSYAIYVFHYFVLLGLIEPFSGRAWFSHSLARALGLLVMYNALCLAVGFVSYHVYEKHFLKLKRYFEPDRRDPATLPELWAGPGRTTTEILASPE